ncbi:Hypothetical predicted protein [Octopus vulgaris]|uniref:Uncharacterized protein n=1 Tax=Octopus vulgaris TaxID=6645 RepID=A0AA36B924_OCTVU|nr:Hypothetical predicted protein [Octopus vulgaris]
MTKIRVNGVQPGLNIWWIIACAMQDLEALLEIIFLVKTSNKNNYLKVQTYIYFLRYETSLWKLTRQAMSVA